MTFKPKQRGTLFTSEEEKQAQIEAYRHTLNRYIKKIDEYEMALKGFKHGRDVCEQKIQELQNLKLEL